MKQSRSTEVRVLFALKQAEAGQPVGDVCRQMGISEAAFYVWKKRYANLGILELRELCQPTPGECAMGPRLLPAEHPPFMPLDAAAPQCLVLPFAGPRQQRAQAADAGACNGSRASATNGCTSC